MTSSSADDPPTLSNNISLIDFSDYFEERLSKCLRFEMMHINSSLEIIYTQLNILRNHIHGSAQSAPNSNSQNRNKKLLDQMETLDPYGLSPPILPDQEFLLQLRVDMKKKLRIVEDMLSSNKGRKDQEWVYTSMACKTCIQIIMSTLDQLEIQQSNQSLLLEHLHVLKESVHKPIAEILSELSNQQSADIFNETLPAAKAQQNAEEAYINARSSELLQKVSKAKLEAEFIEGMLSEIVTPLRLAAKVSLSFTTEPKAPEGDSTDAGSNSKRTGSGKQSKRNSNKGNASGITFNPESTLQVDESNSMLAMVANGTERMSAVWPQILLQLLSCNHGNFLVRCGNMSTMEDMAASVIELQHSVRAVLSDMKRVSFEDSSVPADKNKMQRLSYLKKLQQTVDEFDLECFAAYLDDWRSRVEIIGKLTMSTEFEAHYRHLVKCRQVLGETMTEHEEHLRKQAQVASKHIDVRLRLQRLKDDLEEIFLTEFQEVISITI